MQSGDLNNLLQNWQNPGPCCYEKAPDGSVASGVWEPLFQSVCYSVEEELWSEKGHSPVSPQSRSFHHPAAPLFPPALPPQCLSALLCPAHPLGPSWSPLHHQHSRTTDLPFPELPQPGLSARQNPPRDDSFGDFSLFSTTECAHPMRTRIIFLFFPRPCARQSVGPMVRGREAERTE